MDSKCSTKQDSDSQIFRGIKGTIPLRHIPKTGNNFQTTCDKLQKSISLVLRWLLNQQLGCSCSFPEAAAEEVVRQKQKKCKRMGRSPSSRWTDREERNYYFLKKAFVYMKTPEAFRYFGNKKILREP